MYSNFLYVLLFIYLAVTIVTILKWLLFDIFSDVQDRVMLTGRHIVRDVSCKNCDTKLGWIYEFAVDESQRYKEGRVILERALVTEGDGLEHEI